METEDLIIKVMRYMEWERVQGGLRAILASYTDCSGAGYTNWLEIERVAEEFIAKFGGVSGID